MPLYLRDLSAATEPTLESDWSAAAIAGGEAPGLEAPFPAEARRIIAYRGGKPVARVAFGARGGFSGAAGITGYVGWYAAEDLGAGSRVLTEAAARLFHEGAARVLGPLDGSTWYRYRVALPREVEIEDGQPFFSEPRNPPEWPAHFEAAGFGPELDYETRLVRRPASDSSLDARRAALARMGVRIRPLNLAEYDRELRGLYQLSSDAFAANPFYSPIGFAEFERLYSALRGMIDPALVRLATTADERLLGYVLAYPDALAPSGDPRIVLKTLAAHTDARGMGLGGILVDEVHSVAARRGAAVLHALMQSSNVSRNISGRSGSELFRSYRLYGRAAP